MCQDRGLREERKRMMDSEKQKALAAGAVVMGEGVRVQCREQQDFSGTERF